MWGRCTSFRGTDNGGKLLGTRGQTGQSWSLGRRVPARVSHLPRCLMLQSPALGESPRIVCPLTVSRGPSFLTKKRLLWGKAGEAQESDSKEGRWGPKAQALCASSSVQWLAWEFRFLSIEQEECIPSPRVSECTEQARSQQRSESWDTLVSPPGSLAQEGQPSAWRPQR